MAKSDITAAKKAPFVRFVKREGMKKRTVALYYICAVAAALLIGAVILACIGVNVFDYFGKMLTVGIAGSALPLRQIENYLNSFVPLVITTIGLSLAFKMKFWNIGGEGQFIVGAIVSSAIAFGCPDLPAWFLLLLMFFGGGICAGLYGLITAIFKVKFGTSETLLTLMLNYVALYFLAFLGNTQGEWNIFLNPESVRPIFGKFGENAVMPVIPLGGFSLNITVIVAILIVVLVRLYYGKTKHGYELLVVGDSPNTARYAGMNVGKIILRTVFFSAFLVGLAGAFRVSSMGTLSESVTNDVGWTGVVVAWLAKLNPFGILLVSALINVLQIGSQAAATSYMQIDANFADLLQGIILFIVLACDFFIRFRVIIRGREEKPKNEGKAEKEEG